MSAGNSGVLDYHMLMALQQGWNTRYKGNLTNFSKLFKGISAPVILEWYTALNTRELQIRIEGSKGTPTFPSVVVKLETETMSDYPIGTGYEIGGEYGYSFIVTQAASVEVRGLTPETTRALAVVVRAILHAARQAFVKGAGYSEIIYDGAEALSPEELYVAEQNGLASICSWISRYTAKTFVWIPEVDPLEIIEWFVQAKDIVDEDGLAGGVNPVEEIL